ncbi:hypothetical protein [Hoyosella subflava]|uniref:hypothetical protein n=1 Tax=Hoyosella subflava TaxID=639313 RepID=UPI0002F690B8|nr:hypothetical protein [Hoyosella subflava]
MTQKFMIPEILKGLCDNAAIFPPGLMPLDEAIPAHSDHERAPYSALVGPFIIGADAMPRLGSLLASRKTALPVAATAPKGPGQIPAILRDAAALPVVLKAIEVVAPGSVDEFLIDLSTALADSNIDVFVEIPRDDRREPMLEALRTTPYRAKFRTGGIKPEMHPDSQEFAEAIIATVTAGIAFKATAGLHHAIRNTAHDTGFEQHGFLNVLLAVDTALRGGSVRQVAADLEQRDGSVVAVRIANLDAHRAAAVRATFVSFGTCSIIEPLEDLVALGLVPASALTQGTSA